MSYQRDPLDPLGANPVRRTHNNDERNEIRREQSSWGLVPAIAGFVLLLLLGFLVFSGDRTATPNRTTSTDTQTQTSTPKTTPTRPSN